MKERMEYIDIAKGIGILLVIAGHLFAYRGPISRWIFSFHMPLFFILSGICYKMDSTILVEYLKKKCKQLLIPFCYLYAIGLAVSLIIPSWRENISGLGLIKELVLISPESIHVGQIWFLICLLETEIYILVVRKILGEGWQTKGFFLTAILVKCTPFLAKIIPQLHGRLPFKLDSTLIAAMFLLTGSFMKSNEIMPKITHIPYKSVALICGLVATLMSVIIRDWFNLSMAYYGRSLLVYFMIAVSLSLTVLILSWQLQLSSLVQIKKFLIFLGRNSLVAFGVHSFGIYMYCFLLSSCKKAEIINGINLSNLEAIGGTLFTIVFVVGIIEIMTAFEKRYQRI